MIAQGGEAAEAAKKRLKHYGIDDEEPEPIDLDPLDHTVRDACEFLSAHRLAKEYNQDPLQYLTIGEGLSELPLRAHIDHHPYLMRYVLDILLHISITYQKKSEKKK